MAYCSWTNIHCLFRNFYQFLYPVQEFRLKIDTLKNGTSCIGLYGSAPEILLPIIGIKHIEKTRFWSSIVIIVYEIWVQEDKPCKISAPSTRIHFHRKRYRFQWKRNNCIASTHHFRIVYISFSVIYTKTMNIEILRMTGEVNPQRLDK